MSRAGVEVRPIVLTISLTQSQRPYQASKLLKVRLSDYIRHTSSYLKLFYKSGIRSSDHPILYRLELFSPTLSTQVSPLVVTLRNYK